MADAQREGYYLKGLSCLYFKFARAASLPCIFHKLLLVIRGHLLGPTEKVHSSQAQPQHQLKL